MAGVLALGVALLCTLVARIVSAPPPEIPPPPPPLEWDDIHPLFWAWVGDPEDPVAQWTSRRYLYEGGQPIAPIYIAVGETIHCKDMSEDLDTIADGQSSVEDDIASWAWSPAGSGSGGDYHKVVQAGAGEFIVECTVDDAAQYENDGPQASRMKFQALAVDYIVIDPGEALVAVGAERTFTAAAYNNGPDDEQGTADDISLASTFICTLDDDGEAIGDLDVGPVEQVICATFTATSAGTGLIFAQTAGGEETESAEIETDNITVTVTPNPGYAKVNGGTLTFTAEAKDSKNNPVDGTFEWSVNIGEIKKTGDNTATFTAGEQARKGTVTASHSTGAKGTATVYVVAVDIQPDDNQCGTNGDLVASNKGQDGEKHYVSPKAGANDFVVLKATVAPAQVTFEDAFQWEGGEEVEGHAEKRRVARGAPGKTVVKAKLKAGGDECDKMNVWIVWATIQKTVVYLIDHNQHMDDRTRISGGYGFQHTVAPQAIFTDNDRPDLAGAKEADPPNVGEDENDVYRKGVDLSGGATRKWDVSRQLRKKFINPSGYNFAGPPGNHDPERFKTHANWPQHAECGNDDPNIEGEDNDPYGDVAGELHSDDLVQQELLTAEADVGDTCEMRVHMREFTRVELGGKWYRISGDFAWRIHLKFKKRNEAVDQVDYNGDGDMLDIRWVDDGSSAALNHDGW